MRLIQPVPFVLLALCASIPLGAQRVATAPAGPPRLAALKGAVLTDSAEAPIRGAEVGLLQLRLTTLSDTAGHFRITGIPAGRQVVTVRRLGFSPVTTVLEFKSGDTIDTDFLLVRSAQALGTVSVRGKKTLPQLVEFERRRALGFGRFLTADDLEKNSNRQLAEVLGAISGPSIFRSTATSAAWVAGGRGIQNSGAGYEIGQFDQARGAPTGKCWAAVYLNGTAVFRGDPGEQLFDINTIPVSTIVGIEFYNGAASMPVEFNGTQHTCGALVIWLK